MNPGKSDIRGMMSLALAHQQQGRFAEAEALYRRTLKARPNLPDALHFLGLTLHQQGRSDDGARLMRQAINAQPQNPVFLNNLGLVLKASMCMDEAVDNFATATRIAPGFVEAWFNLGVARQDLGEHALAIEAYQRAIALRPDHVKALVNLAGLLKEKGQLDDAIHLCERALDINPLVVEACRTLTASSIDMGALDIAERRIRAALTATKDNPAVMLSLAEWQTATGAIADALDTCQQIVSSCADPDICSYAAEVCRSAGDLRAARLGFEQALKLAPGHPSATFGLSTVRKYRTEDLPEIQAVARRLAAEKLSIDGQLRLHFALGKAYDDIAHHDDAFAHYADGNRLRHEQIEFDPQRHHEYVSEIIQTFSAELIARYSDEPWNRSTVPIFIVGMPRSGTTLIEQVLASHPQCKGAGELLHIGRFARTLHDRLGSVAPYPSGVKDLSPTSGASLADEYLSRLPGRNAGQIHVTDKMPNNFLHIGLISLLFPQSKIIHCRRDAKDTCLSVYFQLFDRSHSYAFDLTDIGSYFREYERLMEHWRTLLSSRMIDVDYEDFVTDQELQTRRLLDHCELPWHEGCLSFHEGRSTIRSASQWQARQPVYQGSIGRWKNYRNHIAPLVKALGEPSDDRQ